MALQSAVCARVPPGGRCDLNTNVCSRPIADIPLACHLFTMSTKHFVSQQRNAVNLMFGLFAILLAGFWLHALFDWAFSLGWGSDPQVLWAAPLISIFAYGVRFFCMLIFGFVEKNY
jgi:hypothetical protein